MAAFFGSVSDFFSSILAAIINILMTPFHLIEMIGSGSLVISQAVGYIPGELTVFATAGIAICILYLIFGR